MSILKLPRSDNTSATSPTTDGTPSRRNSPNYSRLASSEKSSILSGLLTPSSSARRTRTSGGCASTTLTSTSTAPRTPSGCRGLTKSSTPRGLRPPLLPRLLLRVPPDHDQGRRPGEDRVHHPVWRVLLHDHVLRVVERWRYIATGYLGLLQEATQQECRSLRG
jgi:hypothetical protein